MCPLNFFSVVGILMSIPTSFLTTIFKLYSPLIENWAVIVSLFALCFYFRLGFLYFLEMLFVIVICIIIYWLSNYVNILLTSIGVFVIAWIGQFYGHKVEGMKPSFIKDLQFLLIGTLWVIQKLVGKNN